MDVEDRWLCPSGRDDDHRMRYRGDGKKRWRDPLPPSGKGRGKKGRSGGKASEKGEQHPHTRNAKGRTQQRQQQWEEEDGQEIVEVEAEDEQEPSSGSHTRRLPDPGPFTTVRALAMWRVFMDSEEDDELGYPQFVRNRVRDAVEEWRIDKVSTLLLAHQQLQSLESAPFAEILQARIEAIRAEDREQQQDEDSSALMQASAKVRSSKDGISTFGLDLEFLTDELSSRKTIRAKVRAELLRGLLSKRDGRHAGRASMGSRAASLEAAVVAFGYQGDDEEGIASREDREWCDK